MQKTIKQKQATELAVTGADGFRQPYSRAVETAIFSCLVWRSHAVFISVQAKSLWVLSRQVYSITGSVVWDADCYE